MARLFRTNKDSAEVLIDHLEMAESFFERAKGLLGRDSIAEKNGLWIKPCNNIHTFFMKFPIDCIFVDRKMNVLKVVSKVTPFKLIGPFWKAHSVIEAPAGFAEAKKIQEGDQLYVVT